ncbi:MAG: PLD nuclease N-terminal domain-containing protein [Nitrososphaeria archaeon]
MFMFGLGSSEIVILGLTFLIPIVVLIFWIWTLVDIIRSEFPGSNKVIWILVVIFVPLIGMILYFLIGRKQKLNIEPRHERL